MSAPADVDIVLLTDDGGEIPLSAAERAALLELFPDVAREARKWRAMTGGPGRLLVVASPVIEAYRRGDLSG